MSLPESINTIILDIALRGRVDEYDGTEYYLKAVLDAHWETHEGKTRLGYFFRSGKINVTMVELREHLLPIGYYPYINQLHNGQLNQPYAVSIIKLDSQFDILHEEETQAINHSLDTNALIGQLKKWDAKYGIEIVGAGSSWVEFYLSELPEDLVRFIRKEIHPFCPDYLQQGRFGHLPIDKAAGQEADLIKYQKLVTLWWD